MPAPNNPPPALVGSHVGNYVVERKIGQGGMGEVYLARHPDLGREVAVKILGGLLAADATAIGRFRQEAMAACRIGHDAIVEILDIGQLADGRHYYVMEHLKGQSLHEYLEAAGPQPPQTCLEIIRPVVAALAAAHAVGIVHRDIKPDNIFLAENRDGSLKVKVLDFGIAKLVDTTVPPLVATRSGALIGTPLFMSPEQCAGTGDIGPAADVYAVGAVVFDMVTGRPPFIGEGVGEVLVQHMQAPPPSVRNFQPDLSDALDQVLHCALAKRPAERFQNVAALGAALEAAVTGAAPQTDPGGATLRLSGSTGGAAQPSAGAQTAADAQTAAGAQTAADAQTAALPRALSQTSLSAAAAERVPLPAPASAPTPAPTHLRFLVIAVAVGLIIGAGAVIAGVFLGRSPAPRPQAQSATQTEGQAEGQAEGQTEGQAEGRTAGQVPHPVDAGAARPIGAAQPAAMAAPRPAALPHQSMQAEPMARVKAIARAKARPVPLTRAGATSTPPGDPVGPARPNKVQVGFARKWLKMAKQLHRKGLCIQALGKARMSYRYLKSTAAVRIIGHCSCRVGGRYWARYARWAYRLLGRKDRRAVKATCARRKITLP